MLYAILILSMLVVIQTAAILYLVMKPNPWTSQLMNQNQELLNRIQSPDLRTFQALQNYSKPLADTKTYPRDDATEAKQIQDLTGLGDPLYATDEDYRDTLGDFGIVVHRGESVSEKD